MDIYSNDLNIYLRQVNKILSDYYHKTVGAQREIADAVNSSDFSKAIELTLTSTQLTDFTLQNKIFVGYLTGDAIDMGVMLCGELIKLAIVNKTAELFSEGALAEALMNSTEDEILDLSDEYDTPPFDEYNVHKDDEHLLMGCVIEYTHQGGDATIIEMNFDKYAFNDWLDEHVLVVDGALQFNCNLWDSTSQQAL